MRSPKSDGAIVDFRLPIVDLRSVPGAIATGTHASGVLVKETINVNAGTPEACVPTRSLSLPVLTPFKPQSCDEQ